VDPIKKPRFPKSASQPEKYLPLKLKFNMMRFLETLQGRRSIRTYQDRPVPPELLSSLIQAGEMAPSAGNLRARRYVIVRKPDLIKALSLAAYNQKQVETAPVLIVVCADEPRSGSRYGDRGSLYSIQDATAAVMCILLSAYDMGLGACWNGAFDDDLCREILDLEEGVMPVAIISLG
jgi:nitroreductase